MASFSKADRGSSSKASVGGQNKHPMSKSQIERRTMSRDEVAMWAEHSKVTTTSYLHYWESKEIVPVSDPGDDHLIFVGKYDGWLAKVWTFVDPSLPHKAYILRPSQDVKYDLGSSEGVLLRFQFKGELRIYNSEKVTAIIEGGELSVFQKADDIIIKITG